LSAASTGSSSAQPPYNRHVPSPPKVAAAPITWGVCELPHWGAELNADRVLDEMAAAGFQGTELGAPGFLPQNPELLRGALRKRSLQLVGAFFPLPLGAPDG